MLIFLANHYKAIGRLGFEIPESFRTIRYGYDLNVSEMCLYQMLAAIS